YKITAHARFDTLRDGSLLNFSGKVQRKPLDLLQVLIALGGRDVPEAHLSDILWLDAAGDDAHRAFLTTLQRLRRLLGYKDALVSADGRLTLDPRYAWVDVSAFERLLDQAETAEHRRQGEAACDLRIEALAVYERCSKTLAAALGIKPSAATQALYRALTER